MSLERMSEVARWSSQSAGGRAAGRVADSSQLGMEQLLLAAERPNDGKREAVNEPDCQLAVPGHHLSGVARVHGERGLGYDPKP